MVPEPPKSGACPASGFLSNLRFTATLAPGVAGFPLGRLTGPTPAGGGNVSWSQGFGALMMQSGSGVPGSGTVVIKAGGVPAASYDFNVTG